MPVFRAVLTMSTVLSVVVVQRVLQLMIFVSTQNVLLDLIVQETVAVTPVSLSGHAVPLVPLVPLLTQDIVLFLLQLPRPQVHLTILKNIHHTPLNTHHSSLSTHY